MKKLSPEKIKYGKELIAKLAASVGKALPRKTFKSLVLAKYDVVDITKHPGFKNPKPELDPRKRFLQMQNKGKSKKADIIPFEKRKLANPIQTPSKQKNIKPNPKRDAELIDELDGLLKEEHVGVCDDGQCDINYAYEEGYIYWAIELFSGTGAASSKFKNLYNQLSPDFFKKAEEDRKRMVKSPHVECPHCNSIAWGVEDAENYYCSNCNGDLSA